MKKTLIIIGGVIGFLYSLIGPVVSYADTAALDDEIGFEIASWKVFILESLLCVSVGLLVGWIIFLFLKRL
nr:hypothetical protein [uncultured Flavobacterium sp.]